MKIPIGKHEIDRVKNLLLQYQFSQATSLTTHDYCRVESERTKTMEKLESISYKHNYIKWFNDKVLQQHVNKISTNRYIR